MLVYMSVDDMSSFIKIHALEADRRRLGVIYTRSLYSQPTHSISKLFWGYIATTPMDISSSFQRPSPNERAMPEKVAEKILMSILNT